MSDLLRNAPLPALSVYAFPAWLKWLIDNRASAAVVRFGDGEESVLDAKLGDDRSMAPAVKKLEAQSGRQFGPADVLAVQRGIERAFVGADILGIILGHRLDAERTNDLVNKYLDHTPPDRRHAILTSFHLNHAILDRLPKLLVNHPVSVISSNNVRPVLEGEWELKDVVVYQVPSGHRDRDLDGSYEAAMHDIPIWPNRHRELRRELTVRERGEVFLVGAGLFGKDLCIDIRENGGLAIDLGSALDRIVGKVTRGPLRRVGLLHREGFSVAEISSALEKRHDVEVSQEAIKSLIDEGPPHWTGHPHDWRTFGRILKPRVALVKYQRQLDFELTAIREEARRSGRRAAGLEHKLSARVALVDALEGDVRRVAASRSFRYGHGALGRLSRWMLRRRSGRSGLDSATNLLRRMRGSLSA